MGTFSFMQFDEGRNTLTSDITEESVTKFVKTNSLPLIVDFNHDTAQKVFGGEIRSHVLLFLSKEAGHYDKYLPDQKLAAADYKDKVMRTCLYSTSSMLVLVRLGCFLTEGQYV